MRVGQFVKSKSGRDKGRVFLVFDFLDDDYLLLVDGKLRGVERPKKKKVKHVSLFTDYSENFYQVEDTIGVNNARIRDIIKEYQKG